MLRDSTSYDPIVSHTNMSNTRDFNLIIKKNYSYIEVFFLIIFSSLRK